MAKSWSSLFAIDGGMTIYSYGARANSRRVIDFAGPMLALRVGFAWAP
jgi:hypothetical protein